MTAKSQPIAGVAPPAGKRARTRRRIYDAAMQLFRQHGYRETTIPDICAAADVARATFFLHFPLKSALLVEWSRTITAEWTERRLQLEKMTPSETLRELVLFIFTIEIPPEIASPLLEEFRHEFGEDHELLTAPGTILDEVVRLIAAAQRKRELARDIPARELGMHFHRIMSAYALVREGSIKQRVARAWRLFAHGAAVQ